MPLCAYDEMPVQQLAPGQGKTERADLWVGHGGDFDGGPCIAMFDYQTGRGGAHARRKFFELHQANQSPVAGTAL